MDLHAIAVLTVRQRQRVFDLVASGLTITNESERLAGLSPALDFYNRFRPHRTLGGLTPLQRVNNLPGTYT